MTYFLNNQQLSTGLCACWLSGFIDSDGSFGVYINNKNVVLTFSLGQHVDNYNLFKLFPIFFGGGSVLINSDRLVVYKLSQQAALENHLIPLLEAYPLMTQKRHDFEDFKRILSMVKNKKHLTEKGLDEIRAIKAGMNRGRIL
jgi:hypothetical protein